MQLILFCLVRILCTSFIAQKFISKTFYTSTYKKQTYLCHTIFLFAISIIFQKYYLQYTIFIFIFSFTLCLIFLYNLKKTLALRLSIISYALYYLSYSISSLICALFGSLLYYLNFPFTHSIASVSTCLFTLCFTHLILHTRRIKYGFSLINSNRFLEIFTLISLFFIVVKTIYFYHSNTMLFQSGISKTLPLASILFLLAFLLYAWWRRQITKSYIEKLRKLEIQSLYDELEEKTRLLQKLTADNEALAHIIHRDNKIIPAMEDMVTNYLAGNDFTDIGQMKAYGNELAQRLPEMTKDRKGILDNYEMASGKLKLTGRVSIDAVLAYMQKKAIANHVTLECKHTPENVDYLLTKISEEDLTHLLSDLLENALIAMKEHESGRLVVTFGKLQKEAYISVADTGTAFDLTTLHAFGIAPHTTHEDSGGSGIGLMDIWKIKKKYRATIQIQEYEKGKENFTKRILFSFNAKNHYVIQSYRHTEISNTQTRGDLYIIPIETQKKNGGKQYA